MSDAVIMRLIMKELDCDEVKVNRIMVELTELATDYDVDFERLVHVVTFMTWRKKQ